MCVFEAARRSAAPSWLTPAISSSSPSSLDSAKVFLGSKRGVTHFSIMLSIVWWSWLLAANGDMLSMSLGRRCGALTALCSSSNGRTELKWFAISLSPFSSFFPGWPSQCRSRYCELRSPLQPPDAVADNGGNCNGVGGRTDADGRRRGREKDCETPENPSDLQGACGVRNGRTARKIPGLAWPWAEATIMHQFVCVVVFGT